jgi:Ser/Thr protein kinase RdoA (MazF antagonist)
MTKILSNWGIVRINAKRILRGGSQSNWIVATPSGKYVLRNAGPNRDYVDFQIFIINKLHEHNFPYSIPQLVKARDAYCVPYLGRLWLLYRFIEGRPLKTISAAQSEEIGRLMASYHTITRRIDSRYTSDFSLALFETETVHSVLRERAVPMPTRKARHCLEDLLSRSIAPLLEAYDDILAADKESIRRLPKIPIYDDWHGHNLLAVNGKVIGLVDFDSLVTAPGIVDVQNGLLYAAGTPEGIVYCSPESVDTFESGCLGWSTLN